MNHRKVRVKVPASTANLGPGFDSLGMALNLYAWIEMSEAEQTDIQLYGPHLSGVPTDKSNLIYKIAQSIFQKVDIRIPELEISMYSEIPLTRGLGSSASAIVGAMTAANALAGSPLSWNEIFQMSTEIEKHPDNVGASIFGSMVVAAWDGTRADHIRIELDSKLEVLVAIPDFQLSTEKARNVLPQSIPMKDAVYNVSHSSLLVAALCTGNMEMIKYAMKDSLHQPYRAALIPGMSKILQEADRHGALGIALSGAGPTMLALVDTESKQKEILESFLLNTLSDHRIPARTLWLKPSISGVQVLTQWEEHSTFIHNIKREVQT